MHGGNRNAIAREFGVNPETLMDFSTGINPRGFPSYVRRIADRALSEASEYPDPEYTRFREAAAQATGRLSDEILPGNGSSELLSALLRGLKPSQVILPSPCYVDYEIYCRKLNIPVVPVLLDASDGFTVDPKALGTALKAAPAGTLVIIGNPNNPTGRLLPAGLIDDVSKDFPNAFFCVDEAYREFTAAGEEPLPRRSNLLLLRSLTKIFAVPGFRLGYLLADTRLVDEIRRELPTWNVGTVAARLGEAFLADSAYPRDTRVEIEKARALLTEDLATLRGVKVHPSDANFLLLKLEKGDPKALFEQLVRRGIVVRRCDDFRGLDSRWFRIAVRTGEENAALLDAFRSILGSRDQPTVRRKKPTPAIMFQGTSSNAGKSLMTAALCRILSDQGLKVAPFKAQNMSLNSFVTAEGGEMGRAQVLQAAAARTEPRVLMNPLLLKPTGDQGSQVIVMGKPMGSLQARQYYEQKTTLRNAVRDAYDSLCARYDAVILEGAGSPGEVNLKKHDLVNMPMAAWAKAPVILVGDIDRGGVYASFIGHMAVMEEWERRLVQGFLVNKFRGDATLLDEAHDYIRDYTGKPVIGVMPWVKDHRLPEEDGVDFEERYGRGEARDGEIVLGVVELPRISNSTDIDAFLGEPGVRLVRIDSLDTLKSSRPHAVIIPGTKNVIADFNHIRHRGIADEIVRAARAGEMMCVGICGGFQMLGNTIADPLGLEVAAGSRTDGMGLLDMETVLEEEKTLTQTETTLAADGSRVIGYEIHHGRTLYSESELFTRPGLGCRRDRVWGTYLHGIFDNQGIRSLFLKELGREDFADMPPGTRVKSIDEALDDFADVFRRSVDVDTLKAAMGL